MTTSTNSLSTTDLPVPGIAAERSVLIVKSNLEPFRIPFFGGLYERLARESIQLRVAVPLNRGGKQSAPWLVPVRGGEIHLGGKTLSWQAVHELSKTADLVVVQQSARELTNYWLVALRRIYNYRIGLWGHGKEFQRVWSTPVTEFIKEKAFGNVDFWFAYTRGVAKLVEREGFPAERICAVCNSVDTRREIEFHRAITEAEIVDFRNRLGLSARAALVSYCGALYKAKRLDVLIDACMRVRRAGTDVHLAILGDGDERRALEEIGARKKWVHVLGAAHGTMKALCLASSECMAIPGVVGLALVDSFAHECPLITTSAVGHGPEIEYLVHGVNGIKTEQTVEDFARAMGDVLNNDDLRKKLKQGCREAAEAITIEAMVENFAQGVLRALALSPVLQRSTRRPIGS
jgi:L-malate glycosyltransferase